MNNELKKKLEEVKKSVLIYDIETSANYPDTGEKIDINSNFDDYVKFAKVKWIGMYSYKLDEYIEVEPYGCEDTIKQYIAMHSFITGFNSEAFDTPIMYNNNLMPKGYIKQIDIQQILGTDKFRGHKDRGKLMGYKFKKNSLKTMAETMKLETQKGGIDYNIFFQEKYTPNERIEIEKYLKADVKATKQMFDKLWDFWLPFADFLIDDDVLNLTWIKSSIASLTYRAACKVIGEEATYGDKSDDPKEEMGGRVIQPKYEESRNVWYLDFASLYPHINAMFNLFAEFDISNDHNLHPSNIWHGNDLFDVKGYYDISEQHLLSKDIIEKMKIRQHLKITDPTNSLQYAIKIWLNSLYGAARSPIFEKIHTPNIGWDTCWLGQQINHLTEDMMKEFGFETIAGDTDSIFVIAKDKNNSNEKYVKECLKKVVDKIKENVPFPAETFNIDIEEHCDYVMWPFSNQTIEWDGDGAKLADFLKEHTNLTDDERVAITQFNIENTKIGHNVKNLKNRLIKVRKGKKKNYCYIYNNKDGNKALKLAGLPIKKDNATILGPKIFKEHLELQILENMSAKFPKEYINNLLQTELNKKDGLSLLAREYKVKPISSYKNESQIQAQISLGYFNGQDGTINLIKNKVCGKAGKTAKYCTVEEAIENKLTLQELDLEKVQNELAPFIDTY